MPDEITAEERAAIASFPVEKIRFCHRGESGIPLNGIPPRERQRQAVMTAQRRRQFEKSRAIDDEIRRGWINGLTDKQISEKVKLTPNAVNQRRFRMGLKKREFE